MRTEELIKILAQAPAVKVPLSFNMALIIVLSVSLMTTFFALGLRPDLGNVLAIVTALHKTILLLSVLLLLAVALENSAKPAAKPISFKIALYVLAILFSASLSFEWIAKTPKEILSLFFLPNFLLCLKVVSVYGIAGSAFLTWLMRFYAPSNNKKAAAFIGLTAASAGALGYSIHCPIDSPTFIVITYGLPMLVITIFTCLIVPRIIKW